MQTLELVDRYAKAAFDLAQSEVLAEELRSELDLFGQLMEERPQLLNIFQNPLISNGERRALLESIRPETSSLAERFLTLLVEKRRVNLIPAIIHQLHSMIQFKKGIEDAIVVTARPLDPSLVPAVEKMLNQLTGKKVNLKFEIDESLIGGIQIRIGNRLLDGSVRRKLSELASKLKTTKVY